METYTQMRLSAIHKRRENKRRQRIIKRFCAILTLAAIIPASVGTVYTVSAKEITITEINEFEGTENSVTVKTRSAEVADILKEHGYELADTDKLNLPAYSEISGNGEIVLKRGKEIRIVTSDSTETVVVTSADTEDALLEAGYELSEHDEVTLDGGSIASSETVEIKSVNVTYATITEPIPFETQIEYDPEMYKGESYVKVNGVNGELANAYKIFVYPNGETKESIFDGKKVITEPVTKVIVEGTKEKPTPTPVPAKTIAGYEYSEKITMEATAYVATGNRTATGTVPHKGTVAVDPKVIPLGTKLYIENSDGSGSYGTAVAEDTGGAIKKNRIDLFYESRSAALQFGRRNVNVYILK